MGFYYRKWGYLLNNVKRIYLSPTCQRKIRICAMDCIIIFFFKSKCSNTLDNVCEKMLEVGFSHTDNVFEKMLEVGFILENGYLENRKIKKKVRKRKKKDYSNF